MDIYWIAGTTNEIFFDSFCFKFIYILFLVQPPLVNQATRRPTLKRPSLIASNASPALGTT